MILIKNPQHMHAYVLAARMKRQRVGFVPTMGALHEGHARLMQIARRECDTVAVSIFVNPTQFGPAEDFKKYPRTLQKDTRICKREGVDVVFVPSVAAMYPAGFCTSITVAKLGDVLCGASRPGHFSGVTTVVTKLLNIMMPDRVYFGQKDAQQGVIIKRLIEDLNFPVQTRIVPTVRYPDGLAMSSRNLYLNATQRRDAVILSKALILARNLIRRGERDASFIKDGIKKLITQVRSVRIDYVEILNAVTLEPVHTLSGKTLIALAVYIGSTRLIDNSVVDIKK